MSSKNQSYILKSITISNMVRYEIDRSVLFYIRYLTVLSSKQKSVLNRYHKSSLGFEVQIMLHSRRFRKGCPNGVSYLVPCQNHRELAFNCPVKPQT